MTSHAPSSSPSSAFAQGLLRTIEADLSTLWLPEDPLVECLEAHAHPVAAGGKRIRPLATLLCAAAFGGAPAVEAARPTACAIELVHTYSLVHDDLPCMDDDDVRRGQPTAHVLHGEAKALLVGDGLLTHAFLLVSSRGRVTPWLETLTSREEACDVIEALALAAGPYGMVGGQWLDVSATPPAGGRKGTREALPIPRNAEMLEHVHRLKTGRLLGAALECGLVHGLHAARRADPSRVPVHATAARTPFADDVGLGPGMAPDGFDATDDAFDALLTEARELARAVGENVGIAFQIVDDVLDATADSTTLGKTPGKDAAAGKLTSVALLGLEGARVRASDYTRRAQEALEALLALTRSTGADAVADQARVDVRTLVASLLQRSH